MIANIHRTQADDLAACQAQGGTEQGVTCVLPPPPAPPVPPEANVAQYIEASTGLIAGTFGYSLPWGNCVDEPGVNNPGWGNPIDWAITSTTPWIGASALFVFNHVAVVTGIYANGDVEVRQQNAPGMPHHIPAYLIRGYR